MGLEVTKLSAGYGAIPALKDLSLSVPTGSLIALIGSNGAGKTTALRTIAGLHKPNGGQVVLDGDDITGRPGYKIVRRGVALVPEGRMVVAPLTVAENLELSRHARAGRRAADEASDRVYTLFPRLAERRWQHAGLLSGGEQQMLALGRALMTLPRIVLLDEPSMGLSPAMVDVVFEAIEAIRSEDLGVLLVEQNALLAMELASTVYVIERGEVVLHGRPDELRGSREIEEAYLG